MSKIQFKFNLSDKNTEKVIDGPLAKVFAAKKSYAISLWKRIFYFNVRSSITERFHEVQDGMTLRPFVDGLKDIK